MPQNGNKYKKPQETEKVLYFILFNDYLIFTVSVDHNLLPNFPIDKHLLDPSFLDSTDNAANKYSYTHVLMH